MLDSVTFSGLALYTADLSRHGILLVRSFSEIDPLSSVALSSGTNFSELVTPTLSMLSKMSIDCESVATNITVRLRKKIRDKTAFIEQRFFILITLLSPHPAITALDPDLYLSRYSLHHLFMFLLRLEIRNKDK